MGDRHLTVADARALIAARGVDVVIEVVGNASYTGAINLTQAELEAWLKSVKLEDGDQIKIQITPWTESDRQRRETGGSLWAKTRPRRG